MPLHSLDGLGASGRVVFDDVTLAWLDVQGHEPRVLAGATSLLSRGVPVVSEFYPRVLMRNGTLELLYELAGTHFDSFIDLRSKGGRPERRPVAELPALGEAIEKFTDVLLLPARARSAPRA